MDFTNVKKKASRLGLIVFVGLVTFILYTSVLSNVKVTEKEGIWQVIWEGSLAEASEATPPAGETAFLEIFFVNHSATPATAYDDNTSSVYETWANANLGTGTGNAWANADDFNLQLKHSVAFDVVVRVRYNKTHAWNGTAFIDGDTRVNVTASGGGVTISGATAGTNVVTYNNTGQDFIWIDVYWTNGGAGYQLNKGGTCVISQISIQAKY
jgi:hypothetical protein